LFQLFLEILDISLITVFILIIEKFGFRLFLFSCSGRLLFGGIVYIILIQLSWILFRWRFFLFGSLSFGLGINFVFIHMGWWFLSIGWFLLCLNCWFGGFWLFIFCIFWVWIGLLFLSNLFRCFPLGLYFNWLILEYLFRLFARWLLFLRI